MPKTIIPEAQDLPIFIVYVEETDEETSQRINAMSIEDVREEVSFESILFRFEEYLFNALWYLKGKKCVFCSITFPCNIILIFSPSRLLKRPFSWRDEKLCCVVQSCLSSNLRYAR